MPPSWPVVSQDSGLFQGTAETGSPLASTFVVVGVVALVEQPATTKTKGSKKRVKRTRVMPLVKHSIADLNIAFYVRENFRHRIGGINLGHPDFA
jgi:hypothetical protein